MLAVVLELTAFSTNLVGRFRISDVWKKRFAPHPRTQPQTGRKKARVCENLNTLRRGPPPEFILRGCGGAAPARRWRIFAMGARTQDSTTDCVPNLLRHPVSA